MPPAELPLSCTSPAKTNNEVLWSPLSFSKFLQTFRTTQIPYLSMTVSSSSCQVRGGSRLLHQSRLPPAPIRITPIYDELPDNMTAASVTLLKSVIAAAIQTIQQFVLVSEPIKSHGAHKQLSCACQVIHTLVTSTPKRTAPSCNIHTQAFCPLL